MPKIGGHFVKKSDITMFLEQIKNLSLHLFHPIFNLIKQTFLSNNKFTTNKRRGYDEGKISDKYRLKNP